MEYKAISAKWLDGEGGLNQQVNKALMNGFKIQGGIAVGAPDKLGSSLYTQALFREQPSGGKRNTRRNNKQK